MMMMIMIMNIDDHDDDDDGGGGGGDGDDGDDDDDDDVAMLSMGEGGEVGIRESEGASLLSIIATHSSRPKWMGTFNHAGG